MDRAGEGLEHPMGPDRMSSALPAPHTQGSGPMYGTTPYTTTASSGDMLMLESGPRGLHNKYPNLIPVITTTAPSDGPPATTLTGGSRTQEHRYPDDRNLQFSDEVEAYTSYKAQGHFTPHPTNAKSDPQRPDGDTPPEPQSPTPPPTDSNGRPCVEFYDPNTDFPEEPVNQPRPVPPRSRQMDPARSEPEHREEESKSEQDVAVGGEFGRIITTISSLVDKYWNGNKSLLKNKRFQSQLASLLSEARGPDLPPQPLSGPAPVAMETRVLRLQEELRQAREEKAQLRDKLLASAETNLGEMGDLNMDENKLKSSLIRAQRDLSIVRGRLQKSLEENKELEERQASSAGGQGEGGDGRTLGRLRDENERLRQEAKTSEIRMKQAGQMQELATMLQESHKSLVQTNEHLLRDLEESRRRHQDEVRHLAWTYQQTQGRTAGAPPGGKQQQAYNGNRS